LFTPLNTDRGKGDPQLSLSTKREKRREGGEVSGTPIFSGP